jgi:hypothetical protein
MAEERPRPLRDLGVIDQNKRLRQLANIPGSDETRDHTMPATIREQCDAARSGSAVTAPMEGAFEATARTLTA